MRRSAEVLQVTPTPVTTRKLTRRTLCASGKLVLILTFLLLIACHRVAGPSAALDAQPRPNLAAVDPAVRTQLAGEHQRVEALLAQPTADQDALAAACGRLGQLYHAYEFLEAAGAAYRNAHRLEPQEFRWRYYLGEIDKRQGTLAAAATHFRAAVELQPTSAAAWFKLGEVERAQAHAKDAVRAYERALVADSTCLAARFGLGELAREQGDFATAAAHFAAVLAAQPQAVSVHYPLAQALLRLGRTDEAQQHLQQSAARSAAVGGRPTCADPLDAELGQLTTGAAAHLTRARAAGFAGLSDVEVAELRRAVELAPADPATRQGLGSALARQGDLPAALREYQEAVRLAPQDADYRYDLAVIATRLNQLELARDALTTALRLRPDHLLSQLQLAEVEQRLGRFETALARYEDVLRVDRGNVRARAQRAMTLAQLGRQREAIAELGSVLEETPPRDALSRLNLAATLGALGDVERAMGHLEPIAATAPEARTRAEAHLRIAVLLASKNPASAVAHLREALRLEPDFEPAAQLLRRLGG